MELFAAERMFSPYGTSHQVVLAVFVAGALLAVWLGRRVRRSGSARWASRVLAVVMLVVGLPAEVYQVLPGQWSVNSLPLQLCDLAWFAAVYALWSHRRWACALTYFWGLTLTSQALLTPSLNSADFPDLEFLAFWVLHVAVLWATVFLTWGVGLHPDWRSYRIAVAITVGWAVLMFGVNHLIGSNYGFLNAKPSDASVLDALGPWPWYLLVESVIVLVAWALITWPWVRASRSDRRRAPASGPSRLPARS